MGREADFLRKGMVIDGWELTRRLGQGGQGAVWEVRRKKGRSPRRAMKFCFQEGQKDRQRFLQEIQLIRGSTSAHVLRIFEATADWLPHLADTPPFAYYIAELCLGPLTNYGLGHSSLVERLDYFHQACEAVQSLHEQLPPVLHRDLKPDNFLLADEPRRLVLADFGIARQETASVRQTETGEVVGTPRWRAPEVSHFAAPGSPQSDVYSMGRILEWLLSGEEPRSAHAVPVPRGVGLSDRACVQFDQVVRRATAMDPEARFASMREFLEAVPELWLELKNGGHPQPSGPARDPGTVTLRLWRQGPDQGSIETDYDGIQHAKPSGYITHFEVFLRGDRWYMVEGRFEEFLKRWQAWKAAAPLSRTEGERP